MKPPSSLQTSEFDSSDEEPIEDEQTPIQISWLPLSQVNCSQFLGLCALPGCKFKNVRRNIQKDTEELKSYGIQDIFVFCTRGELSKYRVPNLLDLYHQYGIITHHHPIPDGGTPDIASCCEIMEELAICLKNNRKTLIHCYGGLGRSCLAACLLLYLSDTVSPQQAIDSLRDLRGSGAIQTIKRQRERERGAETQAEAEAGSMQGARRGTRSRVSRITPWAAGGAKPLHHWGCP
ncbi:cyclin-dependent kinase inhibitor 3 isoform X2 [Canis lupus familiaris]|uniref:cyclin-dependent kinase inhibitor 3 isoform X2 n=1 Tax=Canis lupus familiaris TaxID=9615 RepID=UPI000DC66844|nr:cyclin-dependent kinase inhibitor 3 isoform X2 [Canis lupus familiaris]XP_038529589.1 cyclin-dependent kinase inhibitor 3 isoform X2 [Canis lupus familiaris]